MPRDAVQCLGMFGGGNLLARWISCVVAGLIFGGLGAALFGKRRVPGVWTFPRMVDAVKVLLSLSQLLEATGMLKLEIDNEHEEETHRMGEGKQS